MIKDPGELGEQISVLELRHENSTYLWAEQADIWVKAEPQTQKNLFSQVGTGVKSVKFTIWKRDLTLNNAFLWRGRHCFLTDITDIDCLCCEVTAALIEPQTCSVKQTSTPTKDDLNRPIYAPPEVIIFPACLTEKYLGYTQDRPMAVTETTFVLVTPKAITLTVGELVTVGGFQYTVIIPHELDSYKNEYEVTRKGDV